MCEMLAVSSPDFINMSELLAWARNLEELGVAGYGWGLAWIDETGLHRYRSLYGLRKDPYANDALRDVRTRRAFIHLRRPSLMTTQSPRNAQPYCDPLRTYAFAHNGFLSRHKAYRSEFAEQLEGTSDSEVGYYYWLEQLKRGRTITEALVDTHQHLEGRANFMALSSHGTLAVYAGNDENPCYLFRIGSMQLVTTSLHSLDDYVFEVIFPQATSIEQLAYAQAIEIS
ncbi:class II glutamine amidotransferase [Sulfobacillus thermosulfidooxidans]|uniref:class II glutamine amidotransferase n=1 Tax=Sulfobacillus thermosulfidooxidans TaxID=28034 RepID=UPI00096BBEB0|nr:class II glutamine amidotransferase [Sulfobacillus thermosulfidooxidans]OLZ10376.1 hypothetical protein BFX05_10330 [Sulfobacillus thermosulfidooxidans]OLZ15256.1 hypothetical protein BFX06_04785 [Sulfobacillus thermosulfidooxidans]OLZ21123.1 hypothetical protein BFX07_14020 [Sulfobacillus thermosulfidooxidans]